MRVVIVAAGSFAFVMNDDAFRGVHHLEPFASGSETEIKIFESVDEGFVESSEGEKEFSRNQHACSGDCLEFSYLVVRGVLRMEIPVEMVYFDRAESNSRVLDCVIWVEELAAHDANTAVGEYATRQPFTPIMSDFRVVVEKYEIFGFSNF